VKVRLLYDVPVGIEGTVKLVRTVLLGELLPLSASSSADAVKVPEPPPKDAMTSVSVTLWDPVVNSWATSRGNPPVEV